MSQKPHSRRFQERSNEKMRVKGTFGGRNARVFTLFIGLMEETGRKTSIEDARAKRDRVPEVGDQGSRLTGQQKGWPLLLTHPHSAMTSYPVAQSTPGQQALCLPPSFLANTLRNISCLCFSLLPSLPSVCKVCLTSRRRSISVYR